jgi:hypothetical protein
LQGALVSTQAGAPPSFDDVHSYRLRIDAGEIAMTPASLTSLLNRKVFNYQGAPITDVAVSIENGHLKQTGTLHKGVRVPFTLVGDVSVTGDGRIRVHPASVKAAGVPASGLMKLFHLQLDDLVTSNRSRGFETADNDLLLDPERLLASIQFPLIALVAIVVVASMGITSVMNLLIAPAERAFYGVALATAPAVEVASRFGSFPVLPALSGLFAIAIAIPFTWRRAKSETVVPPYLCGENITTEADSFRGAGDQPQAAVESGVYLNSLLGEDALGRIVNSTAIAGLLIMFGVMI